MFEAQTAHWTQWIAQKSYKSSFRRRESRSEYQPKTNTPGLYDGSAEAREILSSALDGEHFFVVSSGVLRHALDYLKGKDVQNIGLWTREFFGEDEETFTFPNRACGPVKDAVFDGESNEPEITS